MEWSGTFRQEKRNIFFVPYLTRPHEYGHTKQLDQLGIMKYTFCIGIPSLFDWGTGDYYSKPWEVTADIYGEVQSRPHSEEFVAAGYEYLEKSKVFGPLVWSTIDW